MDSRIPTDDALPYDEVSWMRGVYRIVNQASGSVYVGSTIWSFERRRGEHLHALTRGKHPIPALQVAWDARQSDDFSFQVLYYDNLPLLDWSGESRIRPLEMAYLEHLLQQGVTVYNRLGKRRYQWKGQPIEAIPFTPLYSVSMDVPLRKTDWTHRLRYYQEGKGIIDRLHGTRLDCPPIHLPQNGGDVHQAVSYPPQQVEI